jgi:uncharacterized protein
MRFVCDVMLGKLVKYLRLLGFDTVLAESEAAARSFWNRERDRLLLTRRRGKIGGDGTIYIHADLPKKQLKEISNLVKPYVTFPLTLKRCAECNTELVDTDKWEIEGMVPEFVFHGNEVFKVCPSCHRVYWHGTHAKNMAQFFKKALA